MKKIILLLLIAISQINYCQNLKTFSGEFTSPILPDGTAKYTYYEDENTHEYVKHGMFKYIFVGKGVYKGYNETITGNFSNGLKNGLWTYNITNLDFATDNPYYTGTVTLQANYKDGYANGNWKMFRTEKKRNKLYTSSGYYWGPFGAVKSMNISMNFSDGFIIGNVNINDEFEKFKTTGNYDNNSMCIGTWKIDNIGWNNHKELIYKDNVLYEFIARDNNGNVLIGTAKYQDQYDNYISAKSSGVEINKNCGIYGAAATSNLGEYFKKILSEDYFLYDEIGGDLTFKEGVKGGCEFLAK